MYVVIGYGRVGMGGDGDLKRERCELRRGILSDLAHSFSQQKPLGSGCAFVVEIGSAL